jgi:GTP cyclohydrolase II
MEDVVMGVPAEQPSSAAVLAVQHAARMLRAGGRIRLQDGAHGIDVIGAETIAGDTDGCASFRYVGGTTLVLTGERLRSLDVPAEAQGIYVLPLSRGDVATGRIASLVDPTAAAGQAAQILSLAVPTTSADALAAVELCKLAGLLPAAILAPAESSALVPAAGVSIDAVLTYRRLSASTLRPVSEARVPLADAEEVRIVSFRPADGGPDQLAILVGDPQRHPAPLARLHSECFTGDFLGSLRCDCGDQLRGAIRRMAHDGDGVLLYLAQEGRGIGLANKLRAYLLQDGGLDTVDANHHLGFANDERDYWAAAAMLRQLGIARVRLLTNNPAKIAQLERYGIEVAGRVPHIFAANVHNRDYLLTKAVRSGHLLEVDDLQPPKNGAAGPRLSVV